MRIRRPPPQPIMKQTAKQRAKGKPSARPRDASMFMVVYMGDDSGSDELVMAMARPTSRNAVAKGNGHVDAECGWKGCLMWTLTLAIILAVGAAGIARKMEGSTLVGPGHAAVAPVFTGSGDGAGKSLMLRWSHYRRHA